MPRFVSIILIIIFIFFFFFVLLPFLLDSTGIAIYPGTIPVNAAIVLSTDSGVSWKDVGLAEQANQAFPAQLYDIVAHPRDPDILYLGTSGSLWESINGGATWARVRDEKGILSYPTNVYQVAISDAMPQLMYLRLYQNGFGRIFRSQDGGVTVEEVFTLAKKDTLITDLALVPNDPMHVFISTQEGLIYESDNGGHTWKPIAHFVQPVNKIIVNPDNPRELYIARANGIASRTVDGGENWHDLASTAQKQSSGNNPFEFENFLAPFRTSTPAGQYSLAIVPGNFEQVYYATPSGMFRSTDSGTTWQPIDTLIPPASVQLTLVNSLPDSPGHIFSAASNHIYESMDGAQTWHIQDIPTKLNVQKLLLQPQKNNRMFVILGQ